MGTPAGSRSRHMIKVYIPWPLRKYSEDSTQVSLEGKTVRELLADLERRYPKLHRQLCDESGAPRRHINVFVNQDHVRELSGLETQLTTNDVVTLMTAVSGG